MINRFCFLHLSDIHFRHGDAEHQADQRLVLNRHVEDVADHQALEIPSPDAILVTGDIAFSGDVRYSDEYLRAAEFLERICGRLGVAPQQVYLVPGNHVRGGVDAGLGWPDGRARLGGPPARRQYRAQP